MALAYNTRSVFFNTIRSVFFIYQLIEKVYKNIYDDVYG